jgi:hypothetical protein
MEFYKHIVHQATCPDPTKPPGSCRNKLDNSIIESCTSSLHHNVPAHAEGLNSYHSRNVSNLRVCLERKHPFVLAYTIYYWIHIYSNQHHCTLLYILFLCRGNLHDQQESKTHTHSCVITPEENSSTNHQHAPSRESPCSLHRAKYYSDLKASYGLSRSSRCAAYKPSAQALHPSNLM